MIKKVDLKGKAIICNNEREVHDVYEGLVAQKCYWRGGKIINPPSFPEAACKKRIPSKNYQFSYWLSFLCPCAYGSI